MDDLLSEFLTETNESMDALDNEIVELENRPDDKELLSNIFRLVHTIKGTCGFLGLPRLESVAHAGENVLGKFRDGELVVTTDGCTAVLDCFDRIKDLLAGLEEAGTEPEGEDTELIDRLNAIADGGAAAPAPAPAEAAPAPEVAASAPVEAPAEVPEPAAGGVDAPSAPLTEELPEPVSSAGDSDELQAAFDAAPGPESAGGVDAPSAPLTEELPEPVSSAGDSDELQAAFDAAPGPESDAPATEEAAPPEPAAAPPVEVAPTPPAVQEKPAAPVGKKPPAKEGGVANQSIRVNVDVLEDLMNLVSELVLGRNQLMQILRNHRESEFALPLQRLSQITSDLQEGVMKTRMQPIGNAWNKLPRIIRDLSIELDKKIDLQMIGAETELDRQVLEMIRDPLTHMVRNSADHGVEIPADRVAAGKPETGKVILNAFHEGGHIIIQIKDDGKGLNLDRIKAKAIENDVVSEADIEGMSDNQVMQLIFRPGFSTAEVVTAVSGRGVGMDVVRTNIEKIGGTIELNSVEGKGSEFTIKIPLTLAIVSALIVESCAEKFAIPQLSVIELVRTSRDSEQQIEMIRGTPVMRLRNRLLPLVSLEELLKLDSVGKDQLMADVAAIQDEEFKPIDLNFDVSQLVVNEGSTEEGSAEAVAEEGAALPTEAPAEVPAAGPVKNDPLDISQRYVVVAKVGNYSYGIIVDDVFDTEEIVVKPVAPILKSISLFSGNTILGDGTVIMILDPNGIASASGEIHASEDQENEEAASALVNSGDKTTLLVFKAGTGGPKAVPLSLVARLEDVKADEIEYAHGQPMIQYRDKLMPLVFYSNEQVLPEKGHIPLIVFTEEDKSMALIIDEITDIVEDKMQTDVSSGSPHLLGSAIIDEKATDIINVGHYLDQAFGDWYRKKNSDVRLSRDNEEKKKVLLIDDSVFFRNLIIPLLSVEGFSVVSLESALQALERCEEGEKYDLIISDIEMPDMNGLEFIAKVKETAWKDTPSVALSSLSEQGDIEKAMAAGFDRYVKKSDRDMIVSTIREILSGDVDVASNESADVQTGTEG